MFPFLAANVVDLTLIIVAFGMIHCVHRLTFDQLHRQPAQTEDYVFKTARLFTCSEFDVFCKAAEEWPVSRSEIETDFKRYLKDQHTPCYVNAFVREHKDQLDHLMLPPGC